MPVRERRPAPSLTRPPGPEKTPAECGGIARGVDHPAAVPDREVGADIAAPVDPERSPGEAVRHGPGIEVVDGIDAVRIDIGGHLLDRIGPGGIGLGRGIGIGRGIGLGIGLGRGIGCGIAADANPGRADDVELLRQREAVPGTRAVMGHDDIVIRAGRQFLGQGRAQSSAASHGPARIPTALFHNFGRRSAVIIQRDGVRAGFGGIESAGIEHHDGIEGRIGLAEGVTAADRRREELGHIGIFIGSGREVFRIRPAEAWIVQAP